MTEVFDTGAGEPGPHEEAEIEVADGVEGGRRDARGENMKG